MLVEEVRKLSPVERFLYWIRERHQIYLRRRAGKPKPWTDDTILQSFFFTNPYRENDKVTVWFRENVRNPLRDSPEVLFATVCFRWFNYIPTGEVLLKENLLRKWDKQRAIKVLGKIRDRGEQVFTGAFMINSPGGEPKLESICRRVDNVWKDIPELIRGFNEQEQVGMGDVHRWLTNFDGMGGFMAYEVVCDLRYTYLLENADDKQTWCHIGPGATRGLYRILGLDFPKGNNSTSPPKLKNGLEEMRKLLEVVQKKQSKLPPFELREIEHSLCELDKYSRALEKDGRLKRTYKGV